MADEQPGGDATAAVPRDRTRVDPAPDEPSTVDAPARWSGSAAVPATGPRKSWWSRRPAVAEDEPDDRAMTPPVDPWEGQDTPWDPMLLPPEIPLPPTRIEAPPTPPAHSAAPPTPPAQFTSPPTGPAQFTSPPTGPAQFTSPPTGPAPSDAPPPRKRRWNRKARPTRQQPVNRVPVAPRPAVVYPPPPPQYQRRVLQAPRGFPPPNQRPLPPPPPRRRRRWPRNLAVFTVLSALCCCGVPALMAWPAAGQYPVTAVLPDSVADLDRRDDAASVRAAERLSEELSSADAFAAIYSDGNGKRVTIFGTTGLRLTPKQDVEAQIAHLTPDYDVRDVQSYDLGVSGAHERCGVGRAGGSTVTVCAWADHGSLATVLMTRRSVADSAELTGVLRRAVLIRG
jgi:hypothetical protein